MTTKILIAIIFLTASSCNTEPPAAEVRNAVVSETIVSLTEKERQTAGIEVGRAEQGLSSSFLRVNGVIDVPPQNIVSISFPLGGYLASTRLLPGMRVQKGQAIAVMQDQGLIQLQQDYLMAKTKVVFLQKEYERQKMLNATKTTSDKVFEQTQSEFQTQRILMNSLREKLRLVHINAATLNENNIRRSVAIYSPISGYVSAVNVNIGKYVNPSDVLFELVNTRDVHLSVKVFEKDLPLVQRGQKIKVALVNNPEKTYTATVSLIARNLDNDRSATVHCHFANPSNDLLPGMYVTAMIETAVKEGINVPEEAVVRWGEGQFVFVQRAPNQFEMTEVTTGATEAGKIAVRSSVLNLLEQTLILRNAYTALMKLQNKAE